MAALPQPARGALRQGPGQRREGGHGEHRPDAVEHRRPGGHGDLGDPPRRHQGGAEERKAEQEGPPPPGPVDHDAAHERTDGAGQAAEAGPGAHRPAAVVAHEHGLQQGERGRREEGGAHPLQRPRRDEELDVGGEPARGRGDGEPDRADDEHPAPAPAVAGGAAEQDERRQGEQVGRDHPLQRGHADAEVLADVGEGDVDDRRVEHRGGAGQHGGGRARCGLVGCAGPTGRRPRAPPGCGSAAAYGRRTPVVSVRIATRRRRGGRSPWRRCDHRRPGRRPGPARHR